MNNSVKQVFLAIVLIAAPVALFSGYELYSTKTAQAATGLGDLSQFKTIIGDVQALVDKGDMVAARARITDFESAWDQAETAIRPLDQTGWGNIDGASDGALSATRSSKSTPEQVKAALAALMATLTDPSKPAE